MVRRKNATVGQIIRRIRSREIAPVYALYGGESFLEDYFISELYQTFLDSNGEKIYLSLDQDPEEKLFRELAAISMFNEKRIIIIREIKKLRSKQGRDELLHYIQFPTSTIILLIISDEYDLRNSFLKKIADHSELLDLRTPFKQEMEKWVRYILNSRKIRITNEALEHYIRIYGDSISHVINEIEKTSLMLSEGEINEKNLENINGFDREFQLWHLQDSLGKKELHTSLKITQSLLEHGTPFTRLLVSLVYLFQQILWKKMGQQQPVGYTGINKIITSNISSYDKGYSHNELVQVLQELRKLDVLCKSTALNEGSLIQPLIVKICQNQYV